MYSAHNLCPNAKESLKVMMTLFNFGIGNNSNIDDEGGGGQKGHFRDDVIRERSL